MNSKASSAFLRSLLRDQQVWLGVFCVVFSLLCLAWSLPSSEWSAVQGTVLGTDFGNSDKVGASQFVNYQYPVGDKTYTGRDTARVSGLAEYVPGKALTVYYVAQDPSRSVLTTPPDSFGMAILFSALSLGALWLLVQAIRSCWYYNMPQASKPRRVK